MYQMYQVTVFHARCLYRRGTASLLCCGQRYWARICRSMGSYRIQLPAGAALVGKCRIFCMLKLTHSSHTGLGYCHPAISARWASRRRVRTVSEVNPAASQRLWSAEISPAGQSSLSRRGTAEASVVGEETGFPEQPRECHWQASSEPGRLRTPRAA